MMIRKNIQLDNALKHYLAFKLPFEVDKRGITVYIYSLRKWNSVALSCLSNIQVTTG